MSAPDHPATLPPPVNRRHVLAAGVAIAVAGLLAYLNTFSVPLLFDDGHSILRNPSIRQLWPPWTALSPPPGGGTTAGRPVLNYTLAVNHAISGTRVGSYHAVNLTLHLLAGLTLFGLLRRSLQQPRLRDAFGSAALPLAALIAVAWVLHPLQTESVTYLIQRAESLVGLFYLLTLYAFVRSVDAPGERRWPVLAVAACALGMGSKEVMVSAPLLVWCYDRTLVSGGFGAALRQRPRFYAALAATWLFLAGLVLSLGGSRGATAGIGHGMTVGSYLLAQSEALGLYLRLGAWPHPLVFDYGIHLPSLREVASAAAVLAALLGAAAFALWRGTVPGLVAAFGFAVLAPSSSIVPITTQTIAEHRMYLPLAGVLALLIAGAWRLLGRHAFAAVLAAAVALGVATYDRNRDYRSETAIWHDTLLKRPANPRPWDNYGLALSQAGRLAEAIPAFERAIELNPSSAQSRGGLGTVLLRLGRAAEARPHFEAAIRLDPRLALGHAGLGSVLYQSGEYAAALPCFAAAVRLDPTDFNHRRNLATLSFHLGRRDEALAAFRETVRLAPAAADAQSDYGGVALLLGHLDLAITHTREAVRLDPGHATARNNLAAALLRAGQPAEALAQAEMAAQSHPVPGNAHFNAAAALEALGRPDEAAPRYRAEIAAQPRHVGANLGLGSLLLRARQPTAALPHLDAAVGGDPRLVAARVNLGLALLQLARKEEAVKQLEAALALDPASREARDLLNAATTAAAPARP